MKDHLKKFTCTLLPILILVISTVGFAEIKEIISEGTYNMGDSETPSVAESRAIMNAKRIALEQAGTYVESYSKVENMQLAKDEIQVLAAGLVEITVLEKKRTIVGDGLHIWVKIKARVKTDNIGEVAKRLQEKIIMDGYKKVLVAYEKSQTDIEQLKKQLAEAKTGKDSNEIKKKIENDETLYKATQWYEKALKHMINKEYDESLEAFTSVIALDPERYEAYKGRGYIFSLKKDYDRALKDYNHFIIFLNSAYDDVDLKSEKDPLRAAFFAAPYTLRGNTYGMMGQNKQAIEDFNRAISIAPSIALNYRKRGWLYMNQGEQDKALADFNRAITLDPNNAEAFNYRGDLKFAQKLYNDALADFNLAIRYTSDNQNLAEYYCARGKAYYFQGNFALAINDLSKSININPDDAITYMIRGVFYIAKQLYSEALPDFNRAIDLDPNNQKMARAYRGRSMIYIKKMIETKEKKYLEPAGRDAKKACEFGDKFSCGLLEKIRLGEKTEF